MLTASTICKGKNYATTGQMLVWYNMRIITACKIWYRDTNAVQKSTYPATKQDDGDDVQSSLLNHEDPPDRRERSFEGDGLRKELGIRAMRRFTRSREGLAVMFESSLLGRSVSLERTRRKAGDTTPRGLTFPGCGSSSEESSTGKDFLGVTIMIESSIITEL